MKPEQNREKEIKGIFSMLGLAMKAGRIASGEFMTEKSVKSGKACLVILAENASENTKNKFRNMCHFYQVPVYIMGTKEGLGAAIGREFRACAALTDKGFAKSIQEKLANCSNMEV